jgi:hypothetical protein
LLLVRPTRTHLSTKEGVHAATPLELHVDGCLDSNLRQ